MFEVVLSFIALLVAILAFARSLRDHFILRSEIVSLQKEVEDAKRVLKHRSNLANEIAHEIKNPITAILCSADTLDLLIGGSLDEDNRRSLRYIREYGDNLLRLVSDFLDLGRIEAGEMTSKPSNVKISPIIESIVGLLNASAQRKDITIRSTINDAELEAIIDPIHIKQVLFNLVHNAIKFTQRAGEILIQVDKDFPRPFIKISVIDNGFGMSQEQIASLFDPYVKFDNQNSNFDPAVSPGVGLGLALCKTLLEIAGGRIEVNSEVNVGSRFDCYIPGAQESSSRATTSQSIVVNQNNHCDNKSFPLNGQQILIVNKDSEASDSLARLINAWGGVAKQVTEAASAVNLLSKNVFDKVIVDEEINREESDLVISEACKKGYGRNPSFIVTGQSNKMSKVAAVLEKPYNGKSLLKILQDN
jgi:signal transduction histidine kinase